MVYYSVCTWFTTVCTWFTTLSVPGLLLSAPGLLLSVPGLLLSLPGLLLSVPGLLLCLYLVYYSVCTWFTTLSVNGILVFFYRERRCFHKKMYQGLKEYIAQMYEVHLHYENSTTK